MSEHFVNETLEDRLAKSRRRGRARMEGGRDRNRPDGTGRGVKRPSAADDGVPEILVGHKIFVNNLPYSVKWHELKDFFQENVGPVRHADVMKHNGKSKGCGIVKFYQSQHAADAINNLQNAELGGRMLQIREDREDEDLRTHSPGSASAHKRGRIGEGGSGGRGPMRFSDGGVVVGKRVYVSNLNYKTSWQTLKDHFKVAGNVKYAEVKENEKGSMGCGIVEFETPEEALNAISTLSNTDLDDRRISVREDREEISGARGAQAGLSQRGGHGGGAAGPSPRGGNIPSGFQIIVQGLPFSATWQELKELAGNAAEFAVIVTDEQTQRSRGYGTVRFSTTKDAQDAIQALHGTLYKGRTLGVKLDKFG